MSRAYSDGCRVYVAGPDDFEVALRKFSKACRETGLFSELPRREYYNPPSVRRRLKTKRVAKRRGAQRRRANGWADDLKPTPAPRG